VRLSPETQVTLYRIVIEALSNVRKHAKASHVALRLTHGALGALLEVSDNGIGFVPEQHKPMQAGYGVGQIAMQRRAELIGCQFEITSQPKLGTTVRVMIPDSQLYS
jgi:signal transduction histidine kinase